MKTSLSLLLAAIVTNPVKGFNPAATAATTATQTSPSLALFSTRKKDEFDSIGNALGRRDALSQATKFAAGLAVALNFPSPSYADDAASTKVVVAGATGQTGRRVLERLAQVGNLQVVGGVRNVDKATASLGESSTVVRGAMVQKVASVDTSAVDLQRLDVVKDSVDELAKTMEGATSLVIATGFIPGNPLKMNAAAHEVDNVGTIKLIDAAKKSGIKKIVMVSSILTNGRNWGQEKSPGFVITNAFGNVLDEKLVAENYLKQSGIDYTIVRPGGLKAKPPTGALSISGEDTLNSGEISRDLVADVCVASLTDAKAANKVLEIIEDEGTPPKVFNGLSM